MLENGFNKRMAVMTIVIEIETKSIISIPVRMIRTSHYFESLFTVDAMTCAAISAYNKSTASRAPCREVACDVPGSVFSSHDVGEWK